LATVGARHAVPLRRDGKILVFIPCRGRSKIGPAFKRNQTCGGEKMNRILSAFLLGMMITASVHAAEPKLTWYGHAAFELSTKSGKVFLIDPWLTNPKAPKNISFKHVEGILITHGHFDHVGEAFDLAKKHNATVIAAYELTEIAKKKGVAKVQPIQPSGSVRIEDITITAVQAVHSSGYADGDKMEYAGNPIGFVIQVDGSGTIYHAGDTGVFSDMSMISELYGPQVSLLPIGGTFTMKPAEAAIAARNLVSKTIIPMHYDTFPALTGPTAPEQLKTEMKKKGVLTNVRVLVPGKTVNLKELL